jgi:hypothetical protein
MLATMIVRSGLRSVANAFLDLCLPLPPHLVLIHPQLPLCHICRHLVGEDHGVPGPTSEEPLLRHHRPEDHGTQEARTRPIAH